MTCVRMGEIAVAIAGEDELVALGLGSCIGLALIDRRSGVAGLAHVVLPESREPTDEPGRFADLAVPALIARMREAGARHLEAALVGGARMFDQGSELDIGARNEAAVREALARAGIPVAAAATGGHRGRTVMMLAGAGTVFVREAGGATTPLLEATSAAHASTHPRPTTTGSLS
jgi:chemotaxis protein CheD